ncbi:MAG: hypothetical protein ACQEQO_11655, partial [Thermodesulfobacteriota bacterium]
MDTLLKRPVREPRPPARLRPGGDSVPEGRAYAPEGTEKKPIVFRSRGVMQKPHSIYALAGFKCYPPRIRSLSPALLNYSKISRTDLFFILAEAAP